MGKFLVLDKGFFRKVISYEAMETSLPLSVTKESFTRVTEEICNATSGDLQHVLTNDDIRLLQYAARGYLFSFADDEDRILFENPSLFVEEEEEGEDGRPWRYYVFSEEAKERGTRLFEEFIKLL